MKSERSPLDRLDVVVAVVAEKDPILLACHESPDGDALGSLLALGSALRALDKRVTMYCQSGVPDSYRFMPGWEGIVSGPLVADGFQAALLLDCHAIERVGAQAAAMEKIPILAVLDHHMAQGPIPDTAVIDPGVSSAGELVWRLLEKLGSPITRDIATNLYVAISTDTGSFSFSNTSSAALTICADLVNRGADPWDIHRRLYLVRSKGRMSLLGQALEHLEYFHDDRLAAMTVTSDMLALTGTTSRDTEGFVEYPRAIEGVDVAVFFREEGQGRFKISLRSKGDANVAQLAQVFGGGGHFHAAGFSLDGSAAFVKNAVVREAAVILPPIAGNEPDA